MNCPIYELSDSEITTINANFLLLDNATVDLGCIVGGISLESPELRAKVNKHFTRISVALNNLRPLVTHLFELQGRDIREES